MNDDELFAEIVGTITVNADDTLIFKLKCGLELMETIERAVRFGGVAAQDALRNGVHSRLGLGEQAMNNGDVIIWHYVNDYSYEVRDWFDEADYPALGDGSLHSRDTGR
jgi:hypothetical protein